MKFEIENNVLVKFIEEKGDRDVVIPDGVTDMGGFWGPAFDKCKYIESVTVPASVKTLKTHEFYYVKNLLWIDCKGEVEIENDYAFPGCKKLVYIVCNPNTPISRLPAKWKQLLAIGVTKYLYDGNEVAAEALQEVKKYITGQNKKKELYKLGYEYPFVAKFMIDQGILSEELYDEMIAYAQENRLAEVLTMLLEGKNKQYPAEGMLDRAEKKFEKEVAHAQKMEDHSSTAYLKTQWSWKKRPDGTLIIWTYKGSDTEVYIPATVGKNKVTALRGHLFQANEAERDNWMRCHLNKIHIAEGVIEIGGDMMTDGPIAYFAIHTDIYIPQSVTKICRHAFAYKFYDISICANNYKIHNVTIHAPAGSYAETYAQENGIPFVAE